MSLNNEAYAAALAEIEEDRLDKGTWARAFAESGGDEAKAKARYIKARAESINGSPTWSDTQPSVEDASKMRVEPVSSSGKGFSATRPSEYYEAAIGEKNTVYYIERFQTFDESGPGLHASWNWAAFIFTAFWALYRKMYAWFFAWGAFGTIGTVLLKIPNPQIQQGVGLAYIACFLGFAIYSNSLYHHKVKAKISSAQKSNSDQSGLRGKLSAVGGVNGWVPIVCGAIPVVGIVAAVALPAYQDYSKGRAVAATQVLAPAPQDWGKKAVIVPEQAPAPAAQQFDPSTAKLDLLPAQTPAPAAQQSQRGPLAESQFQEGFAANKRGDYSGALAFFRPLAENGDADSQYHLGAMYKAGRGAPTDLVESAKWYRLAANQGHVTAQSQLGMMYAAGEGVLQNYRESFVLHTMAAEQGDATGQNQLGIAYLMGQGVPKDYLKAHMWLNLAAATNTFDIPAQNRNVIEKSMTTEQITRAQQMARDCQQKNFKGCN